MNPDGPGFLGQRRERRLDLSLDREHEVGELVHDQHDVGKDPPSVVRVERQLPLQTSLGGERLARTL